MTKLYLDTETCGLHSFPVLLQYAVEEGPIALYDIWKHTIGETLDLIEWICRHTVVGFNLSFDWYHVCKLYTVFRLLPRDWIPEEHIDEIAMKEPEGRDGPCLKPAGALDLLMYSRKGPYQTLMARSDIRIRKVPTVLAAALAEELGERIALDNILFAKARSGPRWQVAARKKKNGDFDPDFSDVVLKFHPAGGLKYLAEYAMGMTPKYHYTDVEPSKDWLPVELGYAPFALAISQAPDWNVCKKGEFIGQTWPAVIHHFIEHWATNEHAREYAKDDIVYTRALDKHFGCPEPNDDDSILTCMVAAVRWHGFTIDIPAVKALLADAKAVLADAPINYNKPKQVRRYIGECMDETEKLVIAETTRKAKLEEIANGPEWTIEEEEPCCCQGGCVRCNHTGVLKPGPHPASIRARRVLDLKIAAKEVELYNKLLRAGRFHASFKVIGTLSSRMSGADGLNAQGIKHTTNVRSVFPLAWNGMVLSIGDFDAFEVTIADGVCNDPDMRADLQSGKKIHGIFGSLMFPDMTYEEILATKSTADDRYTKGKSGFFATILYGGTWITLVRKFNCTEAHAKSAIETLLRKYKKVNQWRAGVANRFCSMTQPNGLGSQVIWREPADYCETLLGFRRYFTLENKICKALFDLARRLPKGWRECKIKVLRRDRVQTADGAVSSACMGRPSVSSPQTCGRLPITKSKPSAPGHKESAATDMGLAAGGRQ